ncbi:hypothetical protein nbrc107696_12980 [Gordonia spumicola]|uniref:Septum formation initiator n=1 Tax=Gordonia spumicola TaxID=589161 RepID=A0A7I9V6N3_9ACTN|nr:septum formation initiator family protein [Gordonia spumicola]GEE00852.1 hypothetical protein nbrc107696_12980 [Gordonia spumicola]
MGGSSSGRSSRDRSDRRTPESARSRTRPRRARTRSDDDLDVIVDAVAPPSRARRPAPVDEWSSGEVSKRAPNALLARLGRVDPKRAAIFGLIVVFLALTLAVPVRTYLSQRAEFNHYQQSNSELSAEVGELQRKVAEQHDPAYIEAQARARLQYVKRGERQLVTIAPDTEQQDAADEAERVRAANPWYQNMWDAVATPPEGK